MSLVLAAGSRLARPSREQMLGNSATLRLDKSFVQSLSSLSHHDICRKTPPKVHIVFRAEAVERARHPRKQPRFAIRSGL